MTPKDAIPHAESEMVEVYKFLNKNPGATKNGAVSIMSAYGRFVEKREIIGNNSMRYGTGTMDDFGPSFYLVGVKEEVVYKAKVTVSVGKKKIDIVEYDGNDRSEVLKSLSKIVEDAKKNVAARVKGAEVFVESSMLY